MCPCGSRWPVRGVFRRNVQSTRAGALGHRRRCRRKLHSMSCGSSFSMGLALPCSHYAISRPLTPSYATYVRVSACFRDNFKLLHQLCARRADSAHLCVSVCVCLGHCVCVSVCELPSFCAFSLCSLRECCARQTHKLLYKK